MSRDLAIVVDRDAEDPLSATTRSLEVRSSFELRLHGRKSPAHVHCRIEGPLEDVARLPQANYYVEPGEETVVPVEIDRIEDGIEGVIEVSTGYGSESIAVDVRLVTSERSVDVDRNFGDPPRERVTNDSGGEPLLPEDVDPGAVGLFVLAVLALVLGVTGVFIAGGLAALVGVGAVGAGLAVALVLLLR